MTSLAAMLACLRDGEAAARRRGQFDLAIALATRVERELAEAARALAALHDEAEKEATLAETEAVRRRTGAAAREAAIASALACGKLIRLPRERARRYAMAPGAGLDVA